MKVHARPASSEAPVRERGPDRSTADPWQRALAKHSERESGPARRESSAAQAEEPSERGSSPAVEEEPLAASDEVAREGDTVPLSELVDLLPPPLELRAPTEPAPIFGLTLGSEVDPTVIATPELELEPHASNMAASVPLDATPLLPEPSVTLLEPGVAEPSSPLTPTTIPEIAAVAHVSPSTTPAPSPSPAREASAPTHMRVESLEELPELWTRLPTGGPSEIEIEVGNLGRVCVRMEMQGDGLKLDIRTDDPRAAAFLQARKTELLEAVASAQESSHVQAEVHHGDPRGRQAPHRRSAAPTAEPSAVVSRRTPPATPAPTGLGLVDIVA